MKMLNLLNILNEGYIRSVVVFMHGVEVVALLQNAIFNATYLPRSSERTGT